jgi:pimeloyl-ACP methyl ester carboxylesterase
MKRLILALLTGAALAASSPVYAAVKTIVLVHGAFADGSGWKPVADILQSHGYSVLVVQEPETSFAADVAATRRVLDKAGPCVLVGHSYGGMIITEAGMHPDVKALVYVTATQPDIGESLSDLADKMPPAAKSIGPVGDGFLSVNPDAFANDFAADAPKPVARFMAISQVPVSGDALKAKATVAPWKQKPSIRAPVYSRKMTKGRKCLPQAAMRRSACSGVSQRTSPGGFLGRSNTICEHHPRLAACLITADVGV